MQHAYFKYIRDVLGVKSILFSEATQVSVDHKIVFLKSLRQWSPSENELFEKMITALELQKSDYALLTPDAVEGVSTKVCVAFDNVQNPSDLHKLHFIETAGPQALLEKPDLKRQTWEALKKAKSLAQL